MRFVILIWTCLKYIILPICLNNSIGWFWLIIPSKDSSMENMCKIYNNIFFYIALAEISRVNYPLQIFYVIRKSCFCQFNTKKSKKDKCQLILHVISNITKTASSYLPPFLVAFLSASLRKNVNAKIGSKQFTFTLRVDLIFLKLTWHIHKKKFWIPKYGYLSLYECVFLFVCVL